MSVDATLTLKFDIRETLSTGVSGASNPVITHDAYAFAERFTSATTPDIESTVVKSLSLTAGAYTLDLTTATGTNGATVDASGKKIRAIKITNSSASNTLTVAKGASNGHTGLGSAFSVVLPANGIIALYMGSGGADVGASDKTLDFAGTGTNSFTVEYLIG